MWYVGVWCIGFWGQFTPSPYLCSENLKSGSLCHWSITNQVQAPLVLRHLSERISTDFKGTEISKQIFEYWNVASTYNLVLTKLLKQFCSYKLSPKLEALIKFEPNWFCDIYTKAFLKVDSNLQTFLYLLGFYKLFFYFYINWRVSILAIPRNSLTLLPPTSTKAEIRLPKKVISNQSAQ